MKTQKSKKFLVQTYVVMVLSFLTIVGIVFINIGIPTHNIPNTAILWGMAVLLGFVVFRMIRRVLTMPEITVSRNGIDFSTGGKQTTIRWSDISDIEDHGRDKKSNEQTVRIKTKTTSQPVVIHYNYYSNANEIVKAIQACRTAVINGETPSLKAFSNTGIQKVSPGEVSSDTLDYVTRWPLFTLYTYLGLLIIYGALYAARTQIPVRNAGMFFAMVILTIMFILGVLMAALPMFKVGVSDRYLVIKNFYFPFYTKAFRLKDIEEVIFEYPNRNSPQGAFNKGMRVILTDESRKVRIIVNFLNRDWKKLEVLLQEKNIPVKNYL